MENSFGWLCIGFLGKNIGKRSLKSTFFGKWQISPSDFVGADPPSLPMTSYDHSDTISLWSTFSFLQMQLSDESISWNHQHSYFNTEPRPQPCPKLLNPIDKSWFHLFRNRIKSRFYLNAGLKSLSFVLYPSERPDTVSGRVGRKRSIEVNCSVENGWWLFRRGNWCRRAKNRSVVWRLRSGRREG